jgi:hypothetical protein
MRTNKRVWLGSPENEGLVAARQLITIFLHACAFRGGVTGAIGACVRSNFKSKWEFCEFRCFVLQSVVKAVNVREEEKGIIPKKTIVLVVQFYSIQFSA